MGTGPIMARSVAGWWSPAGQSCPFRIMHGSERHPTGIRSKGRMITTSGVLPLEFFSGVAFDQDRDEVADGSVVEAVMHLRHGADDRVIGVAVGEGMAESFVHCLDGLRL